MGSDDKNRYDRIFQKVTHKLWKSEINYNKIFQNVQALSVSLENNYSEYQWMHMLLDNFHQGGKYSAQISIYQAELRREVNFKYQK